jgi:glycosyltransferase involved in cell wall biosynthesis
VELAGRPGRGATPWGSAIRVAYLVSRYPAASHAFIQREVEALRALGVEVHTFSIHASAASDLLTARDRDAARATFALFPPHWWALLGAQLLVLSRHPLAWLRAFRAAARLPGASLPTRMRYLLGAVAVWRECRRRGVGHVHAHFTSPAADVAQLVGELGRDGDGPSSWSFTAHGTDILDDNPARLAEKIRRADAVVCVSDFGRGRLMSLVDAMHWEKLRVVRCGVDRQWLAAECPASPGQHGGAVRVLTVGRIEREKGHRVLLDALNSLKRRGMTVHWTLVGDGSLRDSLRRRVEDLGLGGQVVLSGNVGQDRIRSCYLDAHLFCLPSLGEGVPVVLMEAMASGLPVVASQIMGVPELVEHGVSGLLVPPGRPEALADAIEGLARDPGLRRRMGEAGRRRVARDYHSERSAVELRALFEGRRSRGAIQRNGRSVGRGSSRAEPRAETVAR